MNKYVKLGIAALIIVFISIGIAVNLNAPNKDVEEEAKKAFGIIKSAYQEDRNLTGYDLTQLERFEELRTKKTENFNNGDASKKEEKDAVLLYAVGQVVDLYKNGTTGEEFKEKYKQAELFLK